MTVMLPTPLLAGECGGSAYSLSLEYLVSSMGITSIACRTRPRIECGGTWASLLQHSPRCVSELLGAFSWTRPAARFTPARLQHDGQLLVR